MKNRCRQLHTLTPEEKGYLIPYVIDQQNSIYVGMDDGIMFGLRAKRVTYLASSMRDILDGIACNLQPWAREYREDHPYLLDGYIGKPLTSRQKRNFW
ncbi:MAG: super-infection exclusion protein B [Aeromonas sp.]